MNFFTYFTSTGDLQTEDGFDLHFIQFPSVPAILITAESSTGLYGEPCDRLNVDVVMNEEVDDEYPDILYLTTRPVNRDTAAGILTARPWVFWQNFMATQTQLHRDSLLELDPTYYDDPVTWWKDGF